MIGPVVCYKCKYPVSLARCYKCEPWDIKRDKMEALVKKGDHAFLAELNTRIRLHRKDYEIIDSETLLEVIGIIASKSTKIIDEKERSLIIATIAMRLHSEESLGNEFLQN